MKKYLLYGHGGACNHGAEAIVRTTVSLIRAHDSAAQLVLSTHFPEQDREFGLDRLVDRLIGADLSLVPEERAAVSFEEKENIAARIYRAALAEIDAETVCVAVGGDNYCYPNWHRQTVFHRTAKARGGRSVLWCCSIQPEMIDERMAAALREHDRIYARESLTLQALAEHGIDRVTLRRDPAFDLEPEPCPLPEGFIPDGTAALNLSPLALRRTPALLDAFVETARLLLERVDRLLLLPHVTMPADDDRQALRALEQRLTGGERARLCWAPDGANAARLKYLISRCSLLVCCRTHASIAGYSTGVPTLVVGYSVKSRGIARDLDMERWTMDSSQAGRLPLLAAQLADDALQGRRAVRRS